MSNEVYRQSPLFDTSEYNEPQKELSGGDIFTQIVADPVLSTALEHFSNLNTQGVNQNESRYTVSSDDSIVDQFIVHERMGLFGADILFNNPKFDKIAEDFRKAREKRHERWGLRGISSEE